MGSQRGRTILSSPSRTFTSSLGAKVLGTTTWYTNLWTERELAEVSLRKHGWTLLVEPPIGHHKESLFPTVLTPRILNFITYWLAALGIDMDARDDHCVRHRRIIGAQTIGFRERE